MIAEFDTKFSHYRVEDEIYNGRPARVLYGGGGRLVAQSGIPRDGNIEPLFDYNQRFREIVQGARPKRALILGGGVFTLPSVLIRENKDLKLDVAEIDSDLLDIARKYFGYKPNRRMSVYIGDGSKFIAETNYVYDMIIIDAFVDAAIPSSFRTAAFMKNLRTHSSKGGIVAINVIGSLEGLNSSVLRTLHARLQAVFPVVEIFPADRDFSLWMSQNYVLVAHDGSWDLATYMLRSPVDLPTGL